MGIFKSKEEKEFIKKQKREDKELMKRIDKEIKEESRKEYEKFIDEMLLEDDKEEKYLESVMTEEEKKEIYERQKQETVIMITAASIFSVVIIIAVVFIFSADYMSKSKLVKETVPILKDYYKERYNDDLHYLDIEYLCKTNDKNEEECSDIAHLITDENNHIMSINNNMIGDDISINSIINAYNDNMRSYLASLDLISNYPILSYKDYYLNYNIHLDYIHVLPTSVDYQTMRNTKKLTVTEFIFYKGEFDYNLVSNFVSNFSEDSEFYFVKNIRGIPSNLIVIKDGKTEVFDITATIPIENGTYYELDRNKNSVSNINVSKVNGEDVSVEGDYKYTNCYKIMLEENVPWDKKDTMSSYYFIKLDNVDFNEKNIYQFSISSYGDGYEEYDVDEYSSIITFNNGAGTYIIGSESVGIGNISTEDSFLCKIGLC